MSDFFLEQKLKRLEREANDELLMIQEFGPDAFSTYELELLLPLAQSQADQIRKIRQRLFYMLVCVSLWVATAFFCAIVGEHLLGYIFAGMVPLSIVAVLVGHRYLQRRFRSIQEEEIALTIIQQELARRKNYLEA